MNKLANLFAKSASFSSSRRHTKSDDSKALQSILDNVTAESSKGSKVLIIFDIDSTLLDTSYRTGGIFKEFARLPQHAKTYPQLCQEISKWNNTKEVYDPIEFVNQHCKTNIEKDSETGKYLLKFWRKRFFNEDWLVHDLPYYGAQDFVLKSLALGSDIAYLTGREKKTTWDGTIRSLATHGFPFNSSSSRTRLMLKQSSKIKDLIYKREGLEELKQGYNRIFYIENEVELVLMANKEHPDIHTYLFDSVHSGRAKLGNTKQSKISSWAMG